MAAKANQRVRLTKQLLKSSLIHLMHTKSISNITIKEICELAELNRSTFYLHYTDQFQLLEEIESEILGKMNDYLKNVYTDANILSYLEKYLRYIHENGDIFKTLLCSYVNMDFQKAMNEQTMIYLKEQILAVYSGPEANYISCFLMQGSGHIIRSWILSGFDITEKQLAEIIYRLSTSCLTNPC